LESALAKAHNLFVYSSPTLAEMAASYAVGIIINHPFLDGNKRTGFMLAATFLELNGLTFKATEESVVEKTSHWPAAIWRRLATRNGWVKTRVRVE